MILELEHKHDHDHEEEQQEEQESEHEQEEQQQDSQESIEILSGINLVLDRMLKHSQSLLEEETQEGEMGAILEITRVKKHYEDKVYLSFSKNPSHYLQHLIFQTENETTEDITQVLLGRQIRVMKGIRNGKYTLKANDDREKIRKIQNQVSFKLSEMKNGIQSLRNSSNFEEKSEQVFKGYMEFRKKGYYKQKSDQSVKVQKFLEKMQHDKKKMEEDHEKRVQKQEQRAEKKAEEEEEKKEKAIEKAKKKIRKKLQKAKEQKQQQKEDEKKKVSEASSLLEKYRKQKRAYLLIEERYKKQVEAPLEEERKRKLMEIKKIKKPLDSEQLELHQNRYEQFKQKLTQAFTKREEDREIEEKNMEKLKELYHGKFHEKVEEEITVNSYRNIVQEKRKQREKIMSYSLGVRDDYKPKVDEKKKEQLEKIIKLLEIKNDKGKKKKMVKKEDGTVTFEEIPHDQYKRLGISYLEELKQLNEGVVRKSPEERSASMMQLTKKPPKKVYPDYLKEMRTQSRLENSRNKSKHEWRKIISQDSFTNREKYNSVMDHVSLLESEAKQKELELKYLKNGSKVIEMKEKLDKYYLESVSAKMHVLKDVMLKDV